MAFASPPEVMLRQCIRLCTNLKTKRSLLDVSKNLCSAKRYYKAAVCTELGKPFELKQMELPSNLSSTEVLLSIHGLGINFADVLIRKGEYQMKMNPPFVPGTEVAGKVVDVGSGVTNVKKGDRVLSLLTSGVGGAAEFCVAEESALVVIPDSLTLLQAAATLVNYGTAMMALGRKARLQQGETVLVTAAAGATGLAITDIARGMFGCQVISVCGGDKKCQFTLEQGARYAIDYTKDDIRKKVKEFTGGQGVNVVLDQVGEGSLLECIKSMAFEGRAVTIGYASGKIPKIPANILLLKSSSLIGVWWGNYATSNPAAFVESITQVMQGVKEGKIKPYVGETFSLNEINEAYQHIIDRKNIGKVVVKIKEENESCQV